MAFPLGIASGSPAEDGFVLWTRIAPGTHRGDLGVMVEWEVWPENGVPADGIAGRATARPQYGHAVHVVVTGLQSNAWYAYRFRIRGHGTSETGRARTLPAAHQPFETLKICVASCQRWEDGHYAAYRHMARDRPDYVLFLGDYIYEYASKRTGVRVHRESHIVDLDGYRARYALYRSDPALRAMHAACTWIVTPDDHDVEDNYAGQFSAKQTGDFISRKKAALTAFYENMPMRHSEAQLAALHAAGSLPLTQQYWLGSLAGLHVLDTRQQRTPPLLPEGARGPAPSTPIADLTMLGREQEAWLSEGLATAKERRTPWNFIALQSRFTPANYVAGRSRRYGSDTWDAFAASRDRLIQSIRDSQARGVVFLGGDIHLFWAANVHSDPYDVRSSVIAAEFCGTSLSSAPALDAEGALRSRRANPHCLLADPTRRGYMVVQLTAASVRVTLMQVVDVADPDSAAHALARFEVTHSGTGVRVQMLEHAIQ